MADKDTKAAPADIAKLSFEDALQELQDLVRRLEKGQAKLEDAVRDYERGIALKTHCEMKLREAREKVEKIIVGEDGTLRAEPAGFDEGSK